MNSYERVMAVICGQQPDRIPNANILMQFAAKEIGVLYKDYIKNYKNLVEGNLACAQKYGIDVVTVMQSPMSEAHDLGADVIFPEDDVCYSHTPLIKEKKDLLKLKPVQPFEGGMMGNAVKSIESYASQVKNELAIIGWVEGCFAQGADLMGVSEFLMCLGDPDEEEFITDLLDFILEQEILYAKAQVKAGADIIGVGDAIASVAGPVMYETFAQKYEYRLLKAIQEMGVKTKLHICGNIHPFLDQIPFQVCDILDVDWMVPLDHAVSLAKGTSVISGNYNPVSVLLDGTVLEIEAAVQACAQVCGLKHFSSAGCEVPKFTPPENLMQVAKTLSSM